MEFNRFWKHAKFLCILLCVFNSLSHAARDVLFEKVSEIFCGRATVYDVPVHLHKWLYVTGHENVKYRTNGNLRKAPRIYVDCSGHSAMRASCRKRRWNVERRGGWTTYLVTRWAFFIIPVTLKDYIMNVECQIETTLFLELLRCLLFGRANAAAGL